MSLRHPNRSSFRGGALVPREINSMNTEVAAFLHRFRGAGLTTGNVLDELAKIGHDAPWMAREIQRMMQDCPSFTLRIRMMELLLSVMRQSEGSKVQVGDLNELADNDLEQIVASLMKDAKAGNLDLSELQDAIGGKPIDIEVLGTSESGGRVAPTPGRSRKQIPGPKRSAKVPPVKKARKGTKRRKQKRKNNSGRR